MSSRIWVGILAVVALATAPTALPKRHGGGGGGKNKPGVFDYYLLTLSWSPQYCAGPNGQRDKIQCAGPRSFGFVVHGLWPQFENGYPSACSTAPGPSDAEVKAILDIMPSPQLVSHEWQKHGTCSGVGASEYLGLIRKAFQGFQVPEAYKSPGHNVNVKPADFRKLILAANPAYKPDNFTINCSGRYLSEVRICLDRNLGPRKCSASVRDECSVPEMIVRPVR